MFAIGLRAPFRLKGALVARGHGPTCPFRAGNLSRVRVSPQPTLARLFGSNAHSNGGFWRQGGSAHAATGRAGLGGRSFCAQVLDGFARAQRARHHHHAHGHTHGQGYGQGRTRQGSWHGHPRRFWAGEGWINRRELHRIFWRSRLSAMGRLMWKFRTDDCRRKAGQQSHARKMCRRRHGHLGSTRNDRERTRTGLAYFLATRAPHTNPEARPSALHHPQFFARAASASLHAAPTCSSPHNPPTVYSPAPHSYHHVHPLPQLRTSILELPFPPLTPPPRTHQYATTTAIPASSPCFEAGFPILLPLLTILKSSSALNVITMVSRVALTLLPLSVRAKVIYVIRERYLQNPAANSWMRRMVERGGTVTANGASMRLNSRFLLPLLVSLPFLLLASIIAASYERTPLTGRPRIVMLSASEEAELVSSILDVGSTRAGSRDWVTILRSVLDLGDEGVSPTTGRRILLGGEVLDARDWRVRWTDAVLRALEAGVPSLARESPVTLDGVLPPPPTRYPLKARPAHLAPIERSAERPFGADRKSAPLVADYDLLVIDRREANAFSFGFGPEAANGEGRRGVIVVYSGFLDEILGYSSSSVPENVRPSQGVFGSFYPPRKPIIDLTTTPTVLPTELQTRSLAVLLSHELAHLVLSHTLESYASTSLLIPQLSKLGSDVFRTLIYPFTALLGPFLNDSIGASLNVGAAGGFGVVGRAWNSCSSRQLEVEADVVALRLLAHSGIDPRHALDFWEDRLEAPLQTSAPPAPSSHLLRLHSATAAPPPASGHDSHGPDGACGFLSTHPVNSDRIARLRAELDKWLRHAASSTLA